MMIQALRRRMPRWGATSVTTNLGPEAVGGPSNSPVTLLMVCSKGFDANHPNASTMIRLGYCHGFSQVGLSYRLTPTQELGRVLAATDSPIVFLSCYDFAELSDQARDLLRKVPHFVWVNPWFDGMQEFCLTRGLDDLTLTNETYRSVLDSEATFVWSPYPPSSREFFHRWVDAGQRVESIPLACDTQRYYADPAETAFSDVKIAFVGGYRPYKNVQYEKYLKPYEDILTVYGYDEWPYKGYRGLLEFDSERALYQNARVSPALNEPHGEYMGDIVERVFKVLGSRGLAITDASPYYRDLFSEDELLVPRSVDDYHELLSRALSDEEFNQRHRAAGHRAILERHTYAHRARQIIDLLGMSALLDTATSKKT